MACLNPHKHKVQNSRIWKKPVESKEVQSKEDSIAEICKLMEFNAKKCFPKRYRHCRSGPERDQLGKVIQNMGRSVES
jgi:hypothetical protein